MTDNSARFKHEYRISSGRMKGWDYSLPGCYFITICTKNRIPWFGEIKDGEMIISVIGKIACHELVVTSSVRSNVCIDAYVVMPNHIHAVISIAEELYPSVETPRRGVSTTDNWKPGSLGAIVNQFKSVCTKRIRASGCLDFAWQARYYDHIVRNDRELENIHRYIMGNPAKWEEDEYFSQ